MMGSISISSAMARRIVRRVAASARHWFSPDPDRFLKHCSTIVHVGANSGQERDLYKRYDLSVFWIEPIPAVYEELVGNLLSYPKQVAIRVLLADKPGQRVKLNISSNHGASSSIFDLALHRDIWPEVEYVDALEMQTETLDRLVERGLVRYPIDALVLDTQGSELLVLKGAEAMLHRIQYVKTEAADFESYKGGATVADIDRFLTGRSFKLIRSTQFARHPSAGNYYDLVFRRTAE